MLEYVYFFTVSITILQFKLIFLTVLLAIASSLSSFIQIVSTSKLLCITQRIHNGG